MILIKANAYAYSLQQYDLDDYNCTDYALKLFNVPRHISPILISPVMVDRLGPVILQSPIVIISTPQSLYSKLKQLKDSGGPEALNIKINLSRNYISPISKGECN